MKMYVAAYEEGKRGVDDQIDELDSMRQRTVQFLAFVGSATAFLVAAGLRPDARTTEFFVLAGIATGVSILTIVLALFVLLTLVMHPAANKKRRLRRAEWNLRPSPAILIRDWIEPDLGASADVDFFRDLALHYDEMADENEQWLGKVRRNYWIFLAAASLQVVFWAALVWIFV